MGSDSNTETYVTLSLTFIAASFVILALAQPSATLHAQELGNEDYSITNFGLINSNTPFITVQGRVGGSYDASLGDEGYQTYVFKTDKGSFMISVAQGAGSVLYYSAERLVTDGLRLDACLITE